MGNVCKVSFNDATFFANVGDLLLDSALMNGVDMPHDCRAGICGACRVGLVEGRVWGGDLGDGTLHACQARVVSDIRIATESVPDPVSMSAQVTQLTCLAPDVVGVRLKLPKPLDYFPGQYCKVQFRGFPARCYSPTFPLEGAADDHLLQLHIRTIPNGLVSSALGKRIKSGHRVKLTGPLGTAFLRPGHPGRTVLVASGTGFAPMWSVAVGAIFERPRRETVFIVSARNLRSLYMHRALCRLALFPNVTIIPLVSESQTISSAIRGGRPTDHMPELSSDDVVYTAGAPAMTKAVARLAKAAGAACYMDPFESAPRPATQAGVVSRMADWLKGGPVQVEKLAAISEGEHL